MASPVFVDLPKDVFTKVAENVSTGVIHKILSGPGQYLYTYVQPTGDTAPDNDKTLGVPMFIGTDRESIQANPGADIYIMCLDKAGRVRVDV